jgi:hypothetical protein
MAADDSRPVYAAHTQAVIPDRSLDGGRVLWHHWMRPASSAVEGWLREFTTDGRRVRICARQDKRERGHWHECKQIRVVAVLDADKALRDGGEDGNE